MVDAPPITSHWAPNPDDPWRVVPGPGWDVPNEAIGWGRRRAPDVMALPAGGRAGDPAESTGCRRAQGLRRGREPRRGRGRGAVARRVGQTGRRGRARIRRGGLPRLLDRGLQRRAYGNVSCAVGGHPRRNDGPARIRRARLEVRRGDRLGSRARADRPRVSRGRRCAVLVGRRGRPAGARPTAMGPDRPGDEGPGARRLMDRGGAGGPDIPRRPPGRYPVSPLEASDWTNQRSPTMKTTRPSSRSAPDRSRGRGSSPATSSIRRLGSRPRPP